MIVVLIPFPYDRVYMYSMRASVYKSGTAASITVHHTHLNPVLDSRVQGLGGTDTALNPGPLQGNEAQLVELLQALRMTLCRGLKVKNDMWDSKRPPGQY